MQKVTADPRGFTVAEMKLVASVPFNRDINNRPGFLIDLTHSLLQGDELLL